MTNELLVKDLHVAIGLAYYSARTDYRLIREMPTGHGFADSVFLQLPFVGKSALIVELKYDKTDQATIQQIKDRQYTRALVDYVGDILPVMTRKEDQNSTAASLKGSGNKNADIGGTYFGGLFDYYVVITVDNVYTDNQQVTVSDRGDTVCMKTRSD